MAASILRPILITIGCLCVAIGFIGMFIPGLPTFDFLLLASLCFARSSPRLEKWLLESPRFGPAIRGWRQEKSISRRHKIISVAAISFSATLILLSRMHGGAKAALLACMFFVCLYILTRKTRLPNSPCPLRPEQKRVRKAG